MSEFTCKECEGTRKCTSCEGTGVCQACDGKGTVEDSCRHCGCLAEFLPCDTCNRCPGQLEADSDGTCQECDNGICTSCCDEDYEEDDESEG